MVTRRLLIVPLAVLGLGLLCAAWAAAEKANLTLKDGTRMRGDVTETEDEVILRTPVGERRFARSQVARIEYDPEGQDEPQTPEAEPRSKPGGEAQPGREARPAPSHSQSRPARKPAASAPAGAQRAPADDADGQDDGEADPPAGSQPASRPLVSKYKGPAPPPALSDRDMLRLKLYEYPLDGTAEPVHVDFPKKRGEPALEELVARALKADPDVELGWERVLDKGRPPEKLQLILKYTGMRFADRIHIRGDTQLFADFRKQILPVVMKGCTKSGCHGGNTTHHFRFPTNAPSSDEFVYTTFVILDRMFTRVGPMFDRDLPEESAILKYLMFPNGKGEGAPPLHPPVKNAKILTQIESSDSREYREFVQWLSALRVPKPEYELHFKAPDWLEQLSQPIRPPASAEADDEAAAKEKKAASRPTSRPASRPARPSSKPAPRPTPGDEPSP